MSDDPRTSEIYGLLDDICEAVMTALKYEFYKYENLDAVSQSIDDIIKEPANIRICEKYFKSSAHGDVLFFLSNIIYNLKTKNDLVLSSDVLIWLGSVWKNFIKRNKSYQDLFPAFNEYGSHFVKYYSTDEKTITQIENVQLVKEDFLADPDSENTRIKNLEKFSTSTTELLSWMKPTYSFLLDYYYERKLKAGEDSSVGVNLEKNGLGGFGHEGFTYRDVTMLACKSLGVLEALYLVLKKKKTSRQIISINGKSRLLSTAEVYNIYRDKFNEMKNELMNLK